VFFGPTKCVRNGILGYPGEPPAKFAFVAVPAFAEGMKDLDPYFLVQIIGLVPVFDFGKEGFVHRHAVALQQNRKGFLAPLGCL
jgi:hypothetical protein